MNEHSGDCRLNSSAIILAGGFSKRFGRDKGLIELNGKPLVLHVLERANRTVEEIVVVVSSSAQRGKFEPLLGQNAHLVVDDQRTQSPLVGASTGFKCVEGKYSLLLPCDTPFLSSQVASLLLDLCVGRNAVIPRWPNGYIEPLQAAYHTESALKAVETTLDRGRLDFQSMIDNLSRVRFLSTLVLKQIDPELTTFVNVNTPDSLKEAEYILS
jgi:molybdopterin-guanine dinucleotide biosynthesis protein A